MSEIIEGSLLNARQIVFHLRRPQIVNYEIQRKYNACNIEPRTNTNNTVSHNCM
jgi:hypothetical protein